MGDADDQRCRVHQVLFPILLPDEGTFDAARDTGHRSANMKPGASWKFLDYCDHKSLI